MDLAKRFKPEIVLLDYAMPTMNGLEVKRRAEEGDLGIPVSFNLPDVQSESDHYDHDED